MKYRAEIDGLRAIAVLPVIFYHAGFESFSGGFVGVDVFFVISGYLITSIILNDLNEGKFSLVYFYERRIRRILPALFFVMLVSFPFAWFLLGPQEMKDFAQSIGSAAIFCSNFLFWDEDGYFDTVAELKPLLHTWSLAIEEQFYIVFPLLLIALAKLFKMSIRPRVAILTILFFFSLGIAHYGSVKWPSATFYLLPARGWELLLGTFIAIYSQHFSLDQIPVKFRNFASMVGFALVSYSIYAFDKQTPFPSLYTLVPTLGTALIIICATDGTIVNQILRTRTLVVMGLISYSAYLWHHPILVFARYKFVVELHDLVLLGLCAATFPLAYLSWKFIETPFRNREIINRKFLFLSTAFAIGLFVTIGVYFDAKDGIPERLAIPENIQSSLSYQGNECSQKDYVHIREDWYCNLGASEAEPGFLIFGDSHLDSIFPAFDRAARELDVSGIYVISGGCLPFLSVHILDKYQELRNCYELNKRVFEFVKNTGIKNIFLVARWTYYSTGGDHGNEISYISLAKKGKSSRELNKRIFEEGLKRTKEAYTDIGVNLIFVSQVPEQMADAFSIYHRAFAHSNPDEMLKKLSVPYTRHISVQSFVNETFLKEKVKLLSFDDVLCSKDICPVGTSHESYYRNDDHLSEAGALLLVPQLKEFMTENEFSK